MTQIKSFPENTAPSDTDKILIQQSNGITKCITRANFLSGINTGNNSAVLQYDYRFTGDKNGLVYGLGTNNYVATFSNPASNNVITTSSSTVFNNNIFAKAFGRIPSVVHTSNGGNQWVKIDFGSTRKFKVRYYLIQGRNDANIHHLRNWLLQGSNNDSDWDTIDTQVNNTSIGQSTWFLNDVRESNTFYRYLRIFQNGLNSSSDTYLTLGQVEFYGGFQ